MYHSGVTSGCQTPCLDTATSGWKAGYSDDGLHPNLTAQLACARAVQEAIEAIFPDRTPPLAGALDDALNLLQNAPFGDGDADGLADSPWFAGGGGAASVVAGPGGAGNVQVLATTGSAAFLQQNVLTGWSIGERVAFAGLVSADAQAGGMTYSARVAYAGAALGQPRGFAPAHELTGDLPGQALFYGEGVIPPGTLRLEVAFSVDKGRGSIRLGRPTLLNLTRLGF